MTCNICGKLFHMGDDRNAHARPMLYEVEAVHDVLQRNGVGEDAVGIDLPAADQLHGERIMARRGGECAEIGRASCRERV